MIFILIIISIFLSLSLCLLVTKRNQTFKQWFHCMFIRDEYYSMFNMCMFLALFLVFFITCAATYNTYFDKNNPHYYKKINNGQTR